MKPYIGDVTYNMRYKQFSKILSQRNIANENGFMSEDEDDFIGGI